MRKLGLWLMTILVVCLSFISVACSSKNKAKDEVKLNETAITLEIGGSYTLTATTNVKKGVTWSTSDESIATVDGGVVNALSAGSATITATAGKATATCTVTVNEAKEYAELTVDKTVVELKEGGASVSVTATFTVNDEARDCQFVWTSENDAIATVEDGKILPVSAGSTIVTVSVEYKGETYAADVNVEVKPDEQIQVSKRTIELTLADINGGIVSDTFTAIAYKAGVENTEAALEYESSNEEVAIVTVENGVATVTSVGEGTCTISVFYQSSQGKIETNVSVTVTRSTLVLDELIETYYVEGNTSINVAALELQGAFEGVYFEGEKVSLEDDALVDTFVEANKGYVVNIELRTDVAIYSAQLHIFINIVVQGDARTEMPIYSGSATDLGFTEDTKIVYELVTTEATGWETRMVTNVETKKEYVKFDFVSTNKIDSVTMWPEKDSSTLGSYFISGEGAFTNDADPDRQIYVVDQDGYRATKFKAGVVYTVYFYLNEGETMVHFGSFNGTTIYIANIACGNGEIIPIEPENPEPDDPDDSSSEEPDVPVEVPDFVMQGDLKEPAAAYEGDVTALGFAAGTTVYEIANNQEGLWDDCWYTRLSLPLEGTQKSVAIEFIALQEFSGDEIFGVWGVNGVPYIGGIKKAGYAGTWAIITDVDGNQVEEVKANAHYVLHIACENLVQVQVGVLGQNLVYIGNYTCSQEAIPVYKTPTVVYAESGKAAPLYNGDVTEIGFADGTVVYEYTPTIASPWDTRVSIQADPALNCNAVDVAFSAVPPVGEQLIIGLRQGENFFIGARINDCALTHYPSDGGSIDVAILDADGNSVTSFEANTVYTLKIYHGGADEVYLGYVSNDLTVYIGDVENINDDDYVPPEEPDAPDVPGDSSDESTSEDSSSDTPDVPEVPNYVMQGDSREPVAAYTGDVTELGFAAGTTVYVIENKQAGLWDDCWNTRLSLPLEGTQKSVAIEFIALQEFSSNEIFGVWGVNGVPYIGDVKKAGYAGTWAIITDVDGNQVEEVKANTHYVLHIACENLVQVQVGVLGPNLVYIGNYTCRQESIPVYKAPTVVYAESGKAAPLYKGDVTEIGFADGTTVYEYTPTIASPWETRVSMQADPALNCTAIDVAFSAAPPAGEQLIIGLRQGESFSIGARINDCALTHYPTDGGNIDVAILDVDGNTVSAFEANTVYTLKIYHGGADDVFLGYVSNDLTVYIGDVENIHDDDYVAPEQPDDPDVPSDSSDESTSEDSSSDTPDVPEVPNYVMQGDSRDPAAAYTGDVTALGFAAGTTVYVIENKQAGLWDDCWYTRLSLPLKGTQKSVAIEFIATQEFSGDEIFSVWGVNGAPHMGCLNKMGVAGDWAIITDVDGNQIDAVKANTLYVLHIACEDLVQVQVGALGANVIYIGNFACNEEDIPEVKVPTVLQGDGKMPMPAYNGNATDLGFAEGTDVAYELVINSANGKDGWTNRMVAKVEEGKDVLAFDIIVKEMASNDFYFTMWPETAAGTVGSYNVFEKMISPSADADPTRKIFVLGTNGKQPTNFEVGTLYTVYFFLNEGDTYVQFSTFTDGIIYVANVQSIFADEVENDPTLPPPPISQGEDRNKMPTFDGDVTTLGFEAGTTVYQIIGPQGNANDVKLVAQVDPSGDNAYAKLDFVLSTATSSLGLWITAKNSHLGYYTVTPTGFTTDGVGDPSREIFVTNASGEKIQSFEANTKYTLYVGLDGREATIQFTTWASLTIYVANVGCITEAEAPVEPVPPVVDGKEISILFIGNSFSDDTEAYMVDILLNLGYTNINVGNLYIGGCSIDLHYENILSGANAYDFRMRSHNGKKFTEYETVTVGGVKQSLDFAIAYKAWDIISVQQASGESGKADTYKNLDALVTEVKNRATNPEVEFVFNMTWAYQADSTHAQFPDYNSDQATMYNAIVSAVQEKVTYTVVPNGTAIQNARTSILGDNLTRDGYHLDLQIGRFIAGLTFVAKITGEDISNFGYAPNGVTEEQLAIAIESVQNALNTPFAVTQSQFKEEVEDTEGSITQGGSTLPTYTGDVTALGFAEGSTVYKYVGGDSSADKAAIKVDSANYDYVDVQFVIAEGDGYFFAYALKDGNYLNGGASYVIDPSNIRLVNGSAMDRKIQVFDANGEPATTLMSTNTIYTLRVFIKAGEVDQVMIAKNGSTIYLANVTFGLEADLPIEGPIKQGTSTNALPTYTGDATAHGFAEGEFLQYMTTETLTGEWWDSASVDSNGKTREQLAAKIIGEAGKYVTVKFATSEDIASGSVFYVWGLLGEQHTLNGGVNFTSTTHGRILTVDGYPVTSIAKNTVYVLELFIEGTDTYKVANICSTGMEIYFAADSITYSDTSMEETLPEDPEDPDSSPDSEPETSEDPTPQAPIVSGETTSTALSVYDGDVTALGFADGTTVYKLVSSSSWNDRVKIAANPTYKYLDVQFAVTSGNWYFNVWICNANGMLDGSYLVAELGGGTQHATFGDGFAKHYPNQGTAGGKTRIQVLDANGDVIIGNRPNGTVYTLRVWLEEEAVTEVQIGQDGVTMYFGNIESNNTEYAPEEPDEQGPITQGTSTNALPTYTGDATAHGFAEGEFLQYMVTETVTNAWGGAEPTSGKTREQLAANIFGEAGKYVTVKFATSEDIASGSVFYVWGLLNSTYTKDGGLNFDTTTYGRILTVDGYPVSSITKNTVYVLELYMEATNQYKISNLVLTGMELYFASNSITSSDTSMAVKLPGAGDSITAGGSNKNAVTIYNGDETTLGFAEGTTVYKYVGETTNDKISIKVDSANYDFVDVEMVFDAASTKTWFLGFVMSGSSYLNGADAYILSGDNIRFNANASNPLDREIKFLDKDGNVVSSALQTGVLYTLRVYIKANNVTEIQMRQVGVTVYLANVTQGVEEVVPEGPTAVEIKIGDNKADPTVFAGEETMYGFADGTKVVQMALESKADVDNKRLALTVDSSKQYLAIDFALEFALFGNIYVWTVTDGGERVLAATILAEGGVATGNLVNIAIKDSKGNDVTSQVLVGLDSGAAEKYTLYVYYNGANEVHIGCDDYDDEFGGNILYFASAECRNDA